MAVGGRQWPSVIKIVWCELGLSKQNLRSLYAIATEKWKFKKIKLTLTFDISFILGCNSISLISFNSLQYQLLLCFKMDQVVMKLSAKGLT